MIEGLSGPFANAGDAVARNLRIAIDRVERARRREDSPRAPGRWNWSRSTARAMSTKA